MAGDWIKMRVDLQTHPKVVRMMSALKADKYRVIGGLHAVWSVFDAHSEDGRLDGYTLELMDSIIGWPGFSAAMNAIGWLEESSESLVAPGFDTHNGKSAKRRCMETERKRMSRKSSASDADKMRSREEKRREEVNHLSEVASSESDPPKPESPAANATREGLLCRQLRKAGIQDAAPHLLRRQDWQDLLTKRTDAEIVAVAELKVEQNQGKRISLAYLLPALADEGKTARSGAPPPGKHSGFEKIDYRAGVAPDGRF